MTLGNRHFSIKLSVPVTPHMVQRLDAMIEKNKEQNSDRLVTRPQVIREALGLFMDQFERSHNL